MNYPRLFERVYMQPLCVHPSKFLAVHAFLLPRMAGTAPLEIHIADSRNTGETRNPAPPTHSPHNGKRRQKAGPTYGWKPNGEYGITDPRFFTEPREGVAVVPIYGALAKNLSAWEESCGGGTDINAPQEALRQALADPGIEPSSSTSTRPAAKSRAFPSSATRSARRMP